DRGRVGDGGADDDEGGGARGVDGGNDRGEGFAAGARAAGAVEGDEAGTGGHHRARRSRGRGNEEGAIGLLRLGDADDRRVRPEDGADRRDVGGAVGADADGAAEKGGPSHRRHGARAMERTVDVGLAGDGEATAEL
ncbi:MAG: hypothetical protein AVDCRST_MAG19-938, partial [uncultured Thermomicrobiales bacterium]